MNPAVTVIDFETQPIERRPAYPPAPTGVSIRRTGKRSEYYEIKNNRVPRQLREAWASDQLLMWHAKFDLDVAETHLGLPPVPWRRIHDAMLLAFLNDPHQSSISLDTTSSLILGTQKKSDLQRPLIDWVKEHRRQPNGNRLTDGMAKRWIGTCPAPMLGRYAKGDTDLTAQLFRALYSDVIEKRNMLHAYNVERQLIYPLLATERAGLRIDVERLDRDVRKYQRWFERLDSWIRKRIGAPFDLNISSGVKLVASMLSAGLVDIERLGVTGKSGQPCSDKASIERAVDDKQLVAALGYRAKLKTYLSTFMLPWLATASSTCGLVYTSWSTTRTEDSGAKTGRLASSPNFQNVPKRSDKLLMWRLKALPDLPEKPLRGLPHLPYVRSYIVPMNSKHVLIGRDYSQQELRIMAHFEDHKLLAAYRRNPWLDVHGMAQEMINSMLGSHWGRDPVKTVAFGLLYGMGIGKLAADNGTTINEAKALKTAYLQGFPGLRALIQALKERSALGLPMRTIAGREYLVESPRVIDGVLKRYEYRLLNKLIQGSAADVTKQAIINYDAERGDAMLLLTVHDELLVSAPKRSMHRSMSTLRAAMEYEAIDIPLLSEGKVSAQNWKDMKPYDVRGKRV